MLHPRALSIVFACGLLFPLTAPAQNIRLNELLATNSGVLADPSGQFDDWLELYNPGPGTAQLAGFFLSDQIDFPTKWQFPASDPAATQIPPGGFLLVWADDDEAAGPLHAGFKLNATGESLVLTAPDGVTLIDTITFGPQTSNVSFGRLPDGAGAWTLFGQPTPGASNAASPLPPFCDAPQPSVEGGFHSQSLTLAFSSSTPGAQIHLTFDGSEPDESDVIYTQPIVLQNTSVVRARCFAPGYLPGRTSTNSYFFSPSHTFPVVSLVFEPDDFFDSISGIYTNWQTLADAERPVHAEWFEPDGTRGFGLDLGVELSGSGSLSLPQKSLLLKAKPAFGANEIEYAVFPELPYDRYRRLVLRNSGQDWCVTQFRDAAISDLVRNTSDLAPVLDRIHLKVQGFRPAVVYFNGEYRGIFNVHEQLGADFLERHFNLEENEADLIDFYSEAMLGDSVAWFDFWNWLQSHHFQDDLAFKELGQKTDLENFTDYCIFEILSDNVDWPTKNWRRFRPRTPGGRWHWLPYDFDLSFGLLTLDGQWNTGFAGQNAFARAVDSTSLIWPNPDWSTLPLRRALENDAYRACFLNRTADWLNTIFRPERVLERLDHFENIYQPEIEAHFEYWFQAPGWMPYWQSNVQTMRNFAAQRPALCYDHALETFAGDTDGIATVTLTAEPPEGGSVHFSTLHFDADHLPWTGVYFRSIPIPIRAKSAPGWHFAGWSAPEAGSSDSSALILNGDLSLTAFFEPDASTPTTAPDRQQLRISPNPCDHLFWVKTNRPVDNILILNLLGSQVLHLTEPQSEARAVPVEVGHLPAGHYLVRVIFKDGSQAIQSLIKQ